MTSRNITEMTSNRPTPHLAEASATELNSSSVNLGHGDVLIAAITSCTNTSNPSVLIAAGLLAKKLLKKVYRLSLISKPRWRQVRGW